MIKKFLKVMDYSIVIIVLILFGIGVTALYSASGGIDGDPSDVVKQVVWLGVGIVAILVIMFIDYETIGRLWIPAYVLSLLALVAVLFTTPINGASSWFTIKGVGIQPSELTKIVLIISLAKVIDYYKKKGTLNNPTSILVILAMIMVPVLLIIKQPDYGTAMVILVISAVMLFVAGLKWRYIVGAISFAAVMLPLIYMFVLPQHAKDRIAVFLNPQLDPRGKGYNVIQSRLAVGSGRVWGMGLFNGNQTQLRNTSNEKDGLYLFGYK